jgi:CheY-like chemotaxis protein
MVCAPRRRYDRHAMASRRPTAPILIVDDNPETRAALTAVLETEGYHVATATDGQEGLDYLRAGRPACLVILDLRMPIMDGWEFLREVRDDPELAKIPIVAFSAAVESDVPGTVATIRKGTVDPAVLLRVIETAEHGG